MKAFHLPMSHCLPLPKNRFTPVCLQTQDVDSANGTSSWLTNDMISRKRSNDQAVQPSQAFRSQRKCVAIMFVLRLGGGGVEAFVGHVLQNDPC